MSKKAKILISITATIAIGVGGYFLYKKLSESNGSVKEDKTSPTKRLNKNKLASRAGQASQNVASAQSANVGNVIVT